MTGFDYSEFTTRNIGFVSAEEQQNLRDATVFVCGTGGMGGACVFALVRTGIGRLILADIDEFEISNMNRQAFAFMDTVGQHKAHATAEICRRINPEVELKVLDEGWTSAVEECVSESVIIVNGTDDLAASLLLYRTAKAHGKTVIDAYASPLPSIYVTRSSDPAPEQRLGYPTLDTPWNAITADQRSEAFLRELEYVVIHSSSRSHVDLTVAGEVAAGKRSRMSFAPMVLTTGMLMAYEVINGVLGNKHGADCRGWFLNPYSGRIEHPRSAIAASLLRPLVRRFLSNMMGT